MAETNYKPGMFCWIECATSDTAASKSFYSEVLGWTTKDDPVPDGTVYTMLQVGEAAVGGLYALSAEMKAMHAPPHWSAHIAVADAAETVTKARELGATILRDAFDVMDLGRMAVIADPLGATFCVWQAGKHSGAGSVPPRTPGMVTWYEAMTTNVDATVAFYSKLFDWTPTVVPMGGMPYTVFSVGEQQVAGVMEIPPHMREKARPCWMIYFGVESCDQAIERARKLGAQVAMGPTDLPGIGRVALVVDPQGIAFSVHQPVPR